jgi:hypothetical protein
MIDIFVMDSLYWLLETPEADYLDADEFAAALKDRAAYLAHLSAE